MSIERLVPGPIATLDVEALRVWSATAAAHSAPPFDEAVLDLFGRLSRRLFKDPVATQHPELQTLAYWLRPAELSRLRDEFHQLARPGWVRVPRGLVFHVPPSNVDTIFVYSWALATLAGNANVVRLSSRTSPQAEALIRVVGETIAEGAPPNVGAGSLFLRYGHDAAINQLLSAACDTRVIWGGDETVRLMRGFALPPSATELTFPDRFSFALMGAGAVAALESGELEELATRFFNDAFWFDQMGCSSPRLVVWCGAPAAVERARQCFWPALTTVAARKGYDPDAGTVMAKYVQACRAALDHPVRRIDRHGSAVAVVSLAGASDIRNAHAGGGLFYEWHAEALESLDPFVQRRDQTVVHFGIERAALEALVRRLNGRGIDRLVPVGQALSFSPVWDGHALLADLTRIVEIIGPEA